MSMRRRPLTLLVLSSLPHIAGAGELRVEGDVWQHWRDAAELAQLTSADGDVVVKVEPTSTTLQIERLGRVVRSVELPTATTQARREEAMFLAVSLLAELPTLGPAESTHATTSLLQMLAPRPPVEVAPRTRPHREPAPSRSTPLPAVTMHTPSPAPPRTTSAPAAPSATGSTATAPDRTWHYEHAAVDVTTAEPNRPAPVEVTTTVLIGVPLDHTGDLPNPSATVPTFHETDDRSFE